jgi:hypothetical protein
MENGNIFLAIVIPQIADSNSQFIELAIAF